MFSSHSLVVPQQQQRHPQTLGPLMHHYHNSPPLPLPLPLQPTPSSPQPTVHSAIPLAPKYPHHLHSIPPRQKSTRSLILDHMLWLHARTRFSQARAELGLPDLDASDDQASFWANPENGDPHPVQHSRRDALMASLRYPSAHSPMDEVQVEETSRADHVQARALRQKADGLEKVLTAIMDQCSEPPPSLDRDLATHSSSSSPDASKVQPDTSILPNGVRVRLAVGTLINILFSRVDDPLSFDSTTPSVTRAYSSINVSPIPSSLLPFCLTTTESANANGQTHPVPTNKTIFDFNTLPQPSDVAGQAHHAAESPTGGSSSTESLISYRAPGRSKDLYACGVQPPTPLTRPPEFTHHSVRLPIRCTRHLLPACTTCPIQPRSATSIGSGLSRRPNGRPFRKIPKRANGNQKSIDLPHSHSSSSALRSRLVDLIPLFLQLSALVAIDLANESRTSQPCTEITSNSSITTAGTSEAGSPRLSDCEFNATDIVHHLEGSSSSDPRTVSTGSDPPLTSKKEPRRTFPCSSLIGPGPAGTSCKEPKSPTSLPIAPPSAVSRYHRLARPTREWYALLAGLLTRAVLEGYLLKGWKGTYAAETLLSLGLSDCFRSEKPGERTSNISELVEGESPMVNELDPDGLPSVLEAGRILFGERRATVRDSGQRAGLIAEEEFALEMHKRMDEFLSIPSDSPSLTAHLETLSQRYAAGPVEHAALRFLEAVETWRGNPELETYKPNTANHLLSHSRTSSVVLSPSSSLAPILGGTSPCADRGREPRNSMTSTDRPPTPPRERSISSLPGALSDLPTAASQFQAIDQYFMVCLSKPKMPSPKSPAVAKQPKSGAGERWSSFSLGSKRPRDGDGGKKASESTTQVEEERSSKKINIARTA